MGDIHVAIKSYKRAGKISTHRIFPFAHIWVPESQGESYRSKYGDRVITIPDDEDGNLCRKSNAILRRSPSPWTLILDDDITGIGYWEAGDHHWLAPDALEEFIYSSFCLAFELGVELWGVNQRRDELCYHTYSPFALLAPILGPFNGHLSPTIYYDESVLGKDDYDYWLQNIQKVRKTLRFNKYHYSHDHGDLDGGFVSMRSMAAEQKGVLRMRQKWGDKIFRAGGGSGGRSATGQNILNSMIRIPIKGM